jgi:5-methylcytosine-specific restriction endonuclease McrA
VKKTLTARQKELRAAACRRWRKRHPEKQKAATYNWRANNRPAWNAYCRQWRRANKELIKAVTRRKYEKTKRDPAKYASHLAAGRAWMAKHPEHAREKSKRQRAKNPEKTRAYMRAWMKRWYSQNQDKARAKNRKRRAEAIEKWRAYDRALYRLYRAKYPERYLRRLERGRAWAKKNRVKLAHWVSRYRARKRGSPGSHTFAEWIARVELHQWRCAYCGVSLTRKTLTKDHVVPLFRGDTDFAANLVPACTSCNSAKRDQLQFRKMERGGTGRPAPSDR